MAYSLDSLRRLIIPSTEQDHDEKNLNVQISVVSSHVFKLLGICGNDALQLFMSLVLTSCIGSHSIPVGPWVNLLDPANTESPGWLICLLITAVH